MIKLIVATHNENKINEINKMLNNRRVILISLKDLCFKEEIIEDGKTFLENAIIKAKYISNKYNDYYVIADDSGLEVKTLNNEPGINSSRYSDKGDLGNNLKLLDNLKNKLNREARFITSIVLFHNGKELANFEGIWEGRISEELSGTNGFGYDPLFIPGGFNETVASMDISIKNKISHRAKALEKLKDYLNTKIL